MDDMVRSYYRDFKGFIVSLLLVSGLWPDDARQSKILRGILAALTILVLTIFLAGILNFIVHNSGNMMGLVAGIGSIVSFGGVCIRIGAMLLLSREVKGLKGELSAVFEKDLKVPEYREHLLAYYPPFYRFFRAYCYYVIGFLVCGVSVPLVAALRGNYVRMYAIRVPFEYVPGGTLHWLILAFEVISGTYLTINTIGVDTLFGLFTLHMVGELRLLSHHFRSLKPGENYRRELKHCIDRHCLLTDSNRLMNRIFGLISVWLAISCAIIVCSLIYQITQSNNIPIFKLIFAIDYIIAKLLQAYLYAWFSNAITVESERCVGSIYYSNWPESGDVRHGKDVIIIRSQPPIYINAMGIMIVRLDMFIQIVRASISYFFLLKTIEEKMSYPN